MTFCCRKKLLLTLLSCILFNFQVSKSYDRCEFVADLAFSHNVMQPFVNIWVCIIESIIRNDPMAVRIHTDGTKSFGPFRIKSELFCEEGEPGGACNMDCKNFIDDNLNDDILCAHLIFEQVGFNYWPEFDIFCRDPLSTPHVEEECHLEIPTMDISTLKSMQRSKLQG